MYPPQEFSPELSSKAEAFVQLATFGKKMRQAGVLPSKHLIITSLSPHDHLINMVALLSSRHLTLLAVYLLTVQVPGRG